MNKQRSNVSVLSVNLLEYINELASIFESIPRKEGVFNKDTEQVLRDSLEGLYCRKFDPVSGKVDYEHYVKGRYLADVLSSSQCDAGMLFTPEQLAGGSIVTTIPIWHEVARAVYNYLEEIVNEHLPYKESNGFDHTSYWTEFVLELLARIEPGKEHLVSDTFSCFRLLLESRSDLSYQDKFKYDEAKELLSIWVDDHFISRHHLFNAVEEVRDFVNISPTYLYSTSFIYPMATLILVNLEEDYRVRLWEMDKALKDYEAREQPVTDMFAEQIAEEKECEKIERKIKKTLIS